MDLEDRLEELLEDAARAARRQVRRMGASTRGVRRRARRTVRTAGAVTAVVLLTVAAALATFGDPGAIRLLLAWLTAVPGVVAGGAAVAAHVAERRDPRARAERAERRGRPVPVELLADDDRVPRAVRHDWARLLQARRLVQDLAADGWVAGTSMLEVDGEVLRLHRLLVADHRTSQLGGTGSKALQAQVAELADLLVALADEALHLQVEASAEGSRLPATLADARENLVLLRQARAEVADVERGATG